MQSYKTLASSSSAGENFSKEIWYTIKAGVLALVIMFEDQNSISQTRYSLHKLERKKILWGTPGQTVNTIAIPQYLKNFVIRVLSHYGGKYLWKYKISGESCGGVTMTS